MSFRRSPRPLRRMLAASLLGFVCATGSLSAQTTPEAWTFIRGDTNHDTAIDISDAIQLLGQLFTGVDAGSCPAAGDANADGSRDIGDAIYILGYLFSNGSEPPAPFPACGVDPSPNALACDGPLPICAPANPATPPVRFEPPRPAPASPDLSPLVAIDRPGEGVNTPAHHVHLFNGEFHLECPDLEIRGRGLDFRLVRSYRSRAEGGNGWSHSYEVRAAQLLDGSVELDDGSGRTRLYTSDATGLYTTPGFFETGDIPTQDQFRLTFPSGGTWAFHPFDGSPSAGKLTTISDRFGNTLTCVHATDGSLTEVLDTLGRAITFGYDPSGQLTTVTDFTGRTVTYAYYEAGETGGSPGDLKSVTSPSVTNSPTGNDFPNGKTTTYTYSTGHADDRLNHNLLTVTDPAGQVVVTNSYATTTDDTTVTFDTVVRQVRGGAIDLVLLEETPTAQNGEAVRRCIVNDRRGIVSEFLYDAENRCVARELSTGFALADQPTTATTNRPTGKLRQADPDLFTTRWSYDENSVLVAIDWPRGNRTEYTVDSANPDHRMQGNVLEERCLAGTVSPPGDQDTLVESWTYLAGFGGPLQQEFATSHTAPDGTTTTRVLDPDTGALLQVQHPLPGVVEDFEFDAFGRLTAHVHPASNDDPTAPVRRRDEFTYGVVNGQPGYLAGEIIDANGFALTTTYLRDERGNVISTVDSSGNGSETIFNALDQVVIERSREVNPGTGLRYETRFFYDGNDNVVRCDIEQRDEQGALDPNNPVLTTIFEYDLWNALVRVSREVGTFDVPTSPPLLDSTGLPASEFVTTEFEYDANRNRVLVRKGEATNGSQPQNVESRAYDERDLLYREVRGAAPETSTTQVDYDENGNPGRIRTGVESGPRVSLYTYDAFDRVISSTDPMGNITTIHYDPNSNVTSSRVDGEPVDVPGSAGNVRLSEFTSVYDELDRCVSIVEDHFDAQGNPIGDGARTSTYDYFPCGLLRSTTDDKGAPTTFTYDSAHRCATETDALGNTKTYFYDERSNVTRIEHLELPTDASVTPPPIYAIDFTYDGLDRCVTETDPLGRTYATLYDSRDLHVVSVDARGNVTRRIHDGAGRAIEEIHLLTEGGVGTAPLVGQVISTWTYDDSDRCIARTDGNGNATTYTYDALDRQIAAGHPDGTQTTRAYDAHDDCIGSTDANGTSTTTLYDALGRPIDESYLLGPGVAPTTTFETYQYDGLSRVVRAQDDDDVCLFSYDSLSNPTSESTNGVITGSTYDALGNLNALFYPGGRQITCVIDPLDRCQAIQIDPAGGAITFEYLGPGRLQRRSDPTGTDFLPQYDAGHRIVEATHVQGPTGQMPAQIVLGWDADDHKTLREDLHPITGGTLTCTYDSLGRLSDFSTAQNGQLLSSQALIYDGSGNRQQLVGFPLQGLYFLDPSSPMPADLQMNQYTDTPRGGRVYDENGNRLAEPFQGLAPRVYSYDVHDRLVSCDDPFAGQFDLHYDPMGRRTRTLHAAPGQPLVEVAHRYHGGTLIEEQDGTGITLATYVHGGPLGGLLSMQRDVGLGLPEDFYFRCDDLGSVVALCNSAGDVVERYRYSETGAPTILDGGGNPLATSQLGNPFTFGGMRTLPELGVLQSGTRFYDPSDGRFLSRDPAGAFADARNLGAGQAYAGNDFLSSIEHPTFTTRGSGLSKADAKRALADLFNSAASQQRAADHATAGSNTRHSISKRAARTGRNPQTGKEIKIAAKNVSAPRDHASGMASGKRRHKPFTGAHSSDHEPFVFYDIILMVSGGGGNGGLGVSNCSLNVHICHLVAGGHGGGGTSCDGGGGGGGRGADHGHGGRSTGHRGSVPRAASPSGDHEPFVFYDIILSVAGGGGGGNGTMCGNTQHFVSGGGTGGGGSGGRITARDHSGRATGHRGYRPRAASPSGDHEPFVFYDIILMVSGNGGTSMGGGGAGGRVFLSKKGYDYFQARNESSAARTSSGFGGKKGYDAYKATSQSSNRSAAKNVVKFKAGADLSKKVN